MASNVCPACKQENAPSSVKCCKCGTRIQGEDLTDGTTHYQGFEIPAELGGFSKRREILYEDKQPGTGIGISYRSDFGKVDLYIYDYCEKIISDGVDSAVVKAAFSHALENVKTMEQNKIYKIEATMKGQGFFLPEEKRFPFLLAIYVLNYPDGALDDSFLHVLGRKNKIIKLRASFRGLSGEEKERRIKILWKAVADWLE